jgi:hypothetical protein
MHLYSGRLSCLRPGISNLLAGHPGSLSLQNRHAFRAPNDVTASGMCSLLYHASNAARLAGSETVARTME